MLEKVLIRSLWFLLIALIGAFVLIPSYEVFIGGLPFEVVWEDIVLNLQFELVDIWKRVFVFYLALWCGKAILWALATASSKPQ